MSPRSASLESLLDALAGFVRDDGCRLLQVLVDPEQARAIFGLVLAHEHRAEARAPFVGFDEAHAATRPGWAERVTSARRQHERRREASGGSIPALPDPPAAGDERLRFALQLQQLVLASPTNAEGLVVVLAPGYIEAPESFRASVELLLGRAELASVRWIAIEADGDALGPTVAAAGTRARRVALRMAASDKAAELDALVSLRPAAAPRGVTPPPRPDVRAPVDDPDGRRRQEIGRLSLTAALAASRGRHADAVAAQRGARDLASAAGWTSDALTLELALGGHLVSAGQAREAEIVFAGAAQSASSSGMHDKAASAGFGLGATRTLRGERHTALVAYADAAIAADRSGSPVLAIEANRVAGQTALELGMTPQAITFLAKAVALAEAAPPGARPNSGAVAARSLAAICRRRGLAARADELEAQATRLDGDAERRAPASPPPVAAAAPEPAAGFGEGTGMLTLDQIARVHLHGVAPAATPPPAGARSWTAGEIASLQRAVDGSLGEDASRILTPQELAALRGQAVIADDALGSAPQDRPGPHDRPDPRGST